MNLLENVDNNLLGLKDDSNKYEIKDNNIDLNETNDSHSIIVREILKINKDITILDVGCGSGLIGKFFKNNSSVTIDGIEIDKEAAAAAKKIGKYRHVYSCSVDDIDHSINSKYDVIIFADVLEHLTSPYDVLVNMKKYLTKNGCIFVSIPNISHVNIIKNLINNNFNYNKVGILDTTHLRFFTDTSFLKMIKNINENTKHKYDVSFVANTIVLDNDIDLDSDLIKLINSDNKKFVLQNIFKLFIVNGETTLLNNLISQPSCNIFDLINNNYNTQKRHIDELENQTRIYNKKYTELLETFNSLCNENKQLNDEINKNQKELYKNQSLLSELDNDNKNYYNLINSLEDSNRELLNELNINMSLRRDVESKYHAIIDSRIWKFFNLYFSGKDKIRKFKNKALRVQSKINAILDDSSLEVSHVRNNLIRISVEQLLSKLNKYDIVSFDIFDTLIFRKVLNPIDVFQIVELSCNIDNFSKFRIESESLARKKTQKKNYEINIFDIYNELKKNVQFNFEELINKEFEVEKSICYANEYMLKVFEALKKQHKKIIITSDMYWPEKYLRELLNKCGYKGKYDMFVSCDYELNKGNGGIQHYISNKFKTKNIIHIGDNYYSDILGSEKAKWHTYYYKSCKEIACENGDIIYDDSLINSIISSIKINYLYNGNNKYNEYFKYGFFYAGQLTCGFLDYIDGLMSRNELDKILFIARDAKIMHEVYNNYYANYPNAYFITSRSSMLEVSFEKNMKTFMDFYFKQRVAFGKHIIKNTLIQTDLKFLLKNTSSYGLNPNDYLTNENYEKLEQMIYDNKQEINKFFESSKKSAINYFKRIIGDSNKILCVDLGWSGTIVTLLSGFLKENVNDNLQIYASFIGNVDNKKVNALIDDGIYYPYCFSYLNKSRFLDTSTLEGSTKAMILEATFTSNEATLLKYDNTFVYGSRTNNEYILNEIHNGIRKFAEIYKSIDISNIAIKINSETAFRPIFDKLNDYKYIYSIFQNFQEYKDSLPRFSGSKEITTLGKILKDRGLL